jgi:hypothetical protein
MEEKQVLVNIKERSRVVRYTGDVEQLKDALFTQFEDIIGRNTPLVLQVLVNSYYFACLDV